MLLLPPVGWVLDDCNQVVMRPNEKLKERYLYPLHRVYVVPIHFKYVRSLKKIHVRVCCGHDCTTAAI